jgi:hypothetical protein
VRNDSAIQTEGRRADLELETDLSGSMSYLEEEKKKADANKRKGETGTLMLSGRCCV